VYTKKKPVLVVKGGLKAQPNPCGGLCVNAPSESLLNLKTGLIAHRHIVLDIAFTVKPKYEARNMNLITHTAFIVRMVTGA